MTIPAVVIMSVGIARGLWRGRKQHQSFFEVFRDLFAAIDVYFDFRNDDRKRQGFAFHWLGSRKGKKTPLYAWQ